MEHRHRLWLPFRHAYGNPCLHRLSEIRRLFERFRSGEGLPKAIAAGTRWRPIIRLLTFATCRLRPEFCLSLRMSIPFRGDERRRVLRRWVRESLSIRGAPWSAPEHATDTYIV